MGFPHDRAVKPRVRWTGRTLRVEVEDFLYPDTPLAAADQIGRSVAAALTARIPEMQQLHVDGTGRLTAASMRTSAADRACSNGAVSLSDVLNDVAPSKSTAS